MSARELPQSVLSIQGLGWRHSSTAQQMQQKDRGNPLSLGIPRFDHYLGGCPRGRITEIVGNSSTGRTGLLHRLLAQAGANGEYCAIVDTSNSFDPESASMAGVRLDMLVWVKCSGNVEHAMKAADLLIHSGGFGVVALDFCDVSAQSLRRIPLSSWYRFRRVVENTSTVMMVVGREGNAKSCASLRLETKRTKPSFTGSISTRQLQLSKIA